MSGKILLVAAIGLFATPAMATTSLVGSTPSTFMSYQTIAGVAAGLTGGSYSGVGSLFVERVSTATTGFGSICTGSLLSSTVVITAAHCLEEAADPVTKVHFLLPSIDEFGAGGHFLASSWEVSPFWTGDAFDGGDLALFTLSTAANGFDTYDIFDGNPFQAFTRVGTGTVGGPQGTGVGVVADDLRQREGNNLFEATGANFGIDPFILFSDFDDGTAEHDVFGRVFGAVGSQTGIANETGAAHGDSGGPQFIDGKIVSVTSFGLSGAAFGGGCGLPGSIDPYGEGGVTGPGIPLNQCTNSSVGEMNGDTWLLPFSDYINAYVSAHAVPEPATWAQMIAGFGLLGGVMRRRVGQRRLALAAA